MTQEEKQLLLKDLCARLPYGVKVMKKFKTQVRTLKSIDVENYRVYFVENDVNSPFGFDIENPLTFNQEIKPYLRPLSSMTEEERKELESISSFYFNNALDAQIQESLNGENKDGSRMLEYVACTKVTDWLLEHHFDIHGLIERGLAIEATEEMYNFKK